MKCAIVCCLVLGLVACSYAAPYQKRMVYYQPPRMYYNPMRAAPMTQRLMYVQYVQPSRGGNARPSNGVSTFVAGDTVATGSYLKDCDPVQGTEEEQQIEDEPTVIYDGNSAHSVAEAYPAEDESEYESSQGYDLSRPVDEDDSQVQDKDQREFVPINPEVEQAAAPAVPEVPIVPAVPAAPATKPPKRYLPPQKKKATDDFDSPKPESDYVPETRPAREPTKARRPTSKPAGSKAGSDSKPQMPAGTFFPINFGGTQGGAIAIANSFSTGTGGSATSHAIAYGSPESARVKSRPAKNN